MHRVDKLIIHAEVQLQIGSVLHSAQAMNTRCLYHAGTADTVDTLSPPLFTLFSLSLSLSCPFSLQSSKDLFPPLQLSLRCLLKLVDSHLQLLHLFLLVTFPGEMCVLREGGNLSTQDRAMMINQRNDSCQV